MDSLRLRPEHIAVNVGLAGVRLGATQRLIRPLGLTYLDAVLLFLFIQTNAIFQNNRIIHLSDRYIMRGLHWGYSRTEKAITVLKREKMIKTRRGTLKNGLVSQTMTMVYDKDVSDQKRF